MSSSVQEAEVQKKRKDKKKKERMERDGNKEKRHNRHGDDDDKPELSNKKRKSSDLDQSSKKRKHSHTESQLEPETRPEPSPSVQHKKKKHRTSTLAPLPRDQLLTKHTPFLQQRTSFYLPLSPAAHAYPLQGLCAEHLSPLLLTYYPPLHGVVLSYSEPRLSEHPEAAPAPVVDQDDDDDGDDDDEKKPGKVVLAQSLNEYGTPYTWLTATFTLFRPRRGTWLEGEINLQNESLLGLVCYNYFNAVVEREELPDGWRWMDLSDRVGGKKGISGEIENGGGHFVDPEGKRVQGKVVFRVVDFEIVGGVDGAGGSVSIVGSLKEG